MSGGYNRQVWGVNLVYWTLMEYRKPEMFMCSMIIQIFSTYSNFCAEFVWNSKILNYWYIVTGDNYDHELIIFLLNKRGMHHPSSHMFRWLRSSAPNNVLTHVWTDTKKKIIQRRSCRFPYFIIQEESH